MLLQSKIHPDSLKPSSKIIRRRSLLNTVSNNLDKKVFVLKAPPGSGKSSLLYEIVSCSDIPYAYCRMDANDNNVYKIFSYIVGAIENVKPGFGKEVNNFLDTFRNDLSMEKVGTDNINSLVTLLLNELYNINNDFFIVLSDLHYLPKEKLISDALKQVFFDAPANIKFLISSREEIKMGLPVLVARRQALILDKEELRFSPDDIIEIAETIYGKKLSASGADLIYKLTEGWITGIHLCLQAETDELSNSIPGNVYEYFAEEIFEHMDENVQRFLMYTSVPETFETGMAGSLFKNINIEGILDSLIQKNIFIIGNNERYNYSFLFRSFLLNKFEQTLDEASKIELYNSLAGYYAGNGQVEDSIRFYLLAKDFEKAVIAIKLRIKQTLSEDLNLVREWMMLIPDEVINSDEEILYYKGILLKNFFSDIPGSREVFKKVIASAESSDELKIRAESFISEMHLKQGEYETAVKSLQKAIKRYKHPLLARLYFNLSTVYMITAKYDKCENALSKALEIIDDNPGAGLENLKFEIMNSLGGIFLIKSDYVKSSYYFEHCADNISSRFKQFQIYLNVLMVNIYSANFKKAIEVKEMLDSYMILKVLPELKVNYHQAMILLYFEIGDYETSLDYCESLLKYSAQYNRKDYHLYSLLMMSTNYYYLKDSGRSSKYLDLACENTDSYTDVDNAEIMLMKALLSRQAGDLTAAEELLQKCYSFFKEKDIENNKLQTAFYLAGILFEKGAFDKLKIHLEQVFDEAEKKDFLNLFKRELLFDRRLFDFAAENKINRDFVSSVFSNVLDLEGYEYMSLHAKERVSGQIKDLYSIRLELFGNGNLFVENYQIPENKWIRKNFKPVFIYLILNRKDHLSKDFIVDKFLDDIPFEHADNIYHQLLSCIRSALKSGGSKKDFLFYKNKIIHLNENYYYYTDVEEFQKLYAKITSAKEISPALLKKAMGLYKGSFLQNMYDPWIEDLRTEMDTKYLKLLELGISDARERKDHEDIKYYTGLMIKNDNLNEKAYAENIKALMISDDKKAALMVFEEMKTVFERELGEPPSKKIIAEIESLLK